MVLTNLGKEKMARLTLFFASFHSGELISFKKEAFYKENLFAEFKIAVHYALKAVLRTISRLLNVFIL